MKYWNLPKEGSGIGFTMLVCNNSRILVGLKELLSRYYYLIHLPSWYDLHNLFTSRMYRIYVASLMNKIYKV